MSDTKSINWEGPSNWDGSNFWDAQPINLRLKAAAPELLEALQIAKGLLELDLTFREEPIKRKALIAALAAIAKATGDLS